MMELEEVIERLVILKIMEQKCATVAEVSKNKVAYESHKRNAMALQTVINELTAKE